MRAIFIEVWPRWVYLNWPTLNHKAKKHKCHIYLATAILAIHLGYRAPLNPVFRSIAPQTPISNAVWLSCPGQSTELFVSSPLVQILPGQLSQTAFEIGV